MALVVDAGRRWVLEAFEAGSRVEVACFCSSWKVTNLLPAERMDVALRRTSCRSLTSLSTRRLISARMRSKSGKSYNKKICSASLRNAFLYLLDVSSNVQDAFHLRSKVQIAKTGLGLENKRNASLSFSVVSAYVKNTQVLIVLEFVDELFLG